ncbi:putative gustatory receptor 28b isoform X1 [Neodiprion virginianus]|uniref:putative gustatory receptor 28b isoform X1 n=1 Tax=Neodiprion virginianus TaxID=2961670 RepID=UPI001EE77561|nr:putative gustatory receptor 28b isoform X1 [Neodiprion virginianus]XP_046608800.1 putative gustatory receptor 28b isoform X1 [Neodiprion virginianus]
MKRLGRNVAATRMRELNVALRPLRIVSQILGLNIQGKWGRAYTLWVFLVVGGLLYGSFVFLLSGKAETLTNIDSLILWAQAAANAILVAVILVTCLVQPHRFLFPIQDMRRVDVVLRWLETPLKTPPRGLIAISVSSAFRYLGARITNAWLRRRQLVQISMSLAFPVVLGYRDLFKMFQFSSVLILVHCLCYGYAVSSTMVIDCLFVDYLAVITDRFSELNRVLKAFVEHRKPPVGLGLVFVAADSDRGTLGKENARIVANVEKLRLAHHDLCEISKKVNGSFGVQLLAITAISLVMVTGQLYEAYHFILLEQNPAEIAVQKVMWFTFYVGRLSYVSYACSRASNEASRTAVIIYEIPLHQASSLLSTQVNYVSPFFLKLIPVATSISRPFQIQHFCLQMSQESLNFNACGFFTIDRRLLSAVSCSIESLDRTASSPLNFVPDRWSGFNLLGDTDTNGQENSMQLGHDDELGNVETNSLTLVKPIKLRSKNPSHRSRKRAAPGLGMRCGRLRHEICETLS